MTNHAAVDPDDGLVFHHTSFGGAPSYEPPRYDRRDHRKSFTNMSPNEQLQAMDLAQEWAQGTNEIRASTIPVGIMRNNQWSFSILTRTNLPSADTDSAVQEVRDLSRLVWRAQG